MSPRKRRAADTTSIRAGGGVFQGDIKNQGGQIAGRDLSVVNISNQNILHTIYEAIEARPETTKDDKEELKSLAKEVDEEIKQPAPNQRLVTRLFKDIRKMAPDILDVVLATLASPAAGLSLAAKKIVEKVQKEASAPVAEGE